MVHFRYTIWFVLKKVLGRTCFFTVCGGACMYKKTKSQQRRLKKIVCQNFQLIQPLKITFCVLVVFIIDMNKYKESSKNSWKKIVQLLWTVITYLLKQYWIWNWTWFCLWSLHRCIRFISELYSRFGEYLSI